MENADPEKRRQLQDVFFPAGVTWDGEAFGTPETWFFFSELRTLDREKAGLVDQRGFEPLTS